MRTCYCISFISCPCYCVPVVVNSKLLWINITEIIYIDFSCCSQAKWAFRKTCINTLSLAFVVFWGSHCYFFLSKPIHSAQLNKDYLRSTFSVETITEIVFTHLYTYPQFSNSQFQCFPGPALTEVLFVFCFFFCS